jgi:hypothetical protein
MFTATQLAKYQSVPSIDRLSQGLEDSVSSVRDSFSEALGAILALSVNPDAQVIV